MAGHPGAARHPGAHRRGRVGGPRTSRSPTRSCRPPWPCTGRADFDDAVAKAEALVALGGIGHTSVLYTDQDQHQAGARRHFGARMKTARILINTPSSQGGIGDLYNFKLAPSLTLGCGSWGGNSISENVGPKHLINKKDRGQAGREHAVVQAAQAASTSAGAACPSPWRSCAGASAPPSSPTASCSSHGYVDDTVSDPEEAGPGSGRLPRSRGRSDAGGGAPGAAMPRGFKPDVIVALGGGSPMDAAKIMGVMYEHPEVHVRGPGPALHGHPQAHLPVPEAWA